jgi:hypothetical protein
MAYSRERPTGVTIIGVLMLISGLLTLCGGVFAVTGAPIEALRAGIGDAFGQGAEGIWSIIIGALSIILAASFLSLQKWAYNVILIFNIVTIVFASRCGMRLLNPMFYCTNIIPLLVVGYLALDHDVRRAFRV